MFACAIWTSITALARNAELDHFGRLLVDFPDASCELHLEPATDTVGSPIANQMYLISRASTETTVRDYRPQTHALSGCQLGFRCSSF